MKEIKRLLVANRGEIALRIMRTAREMGIECIAIYSEADVASPHVKFADEAFLLGPPPSNESYLLGEKIIDICLNNDIDAIHPGYGFLSENAEFTRKVNKAGITFIGPTPEAMEVMGSKLEAKQAVKQYNVPLVPGLDEAIKDIGDAKKVAEEIGFPVLVKASAGGGGKGMRVVERAEDFEEQMERAVSEAESYFGDGRVFIEKYVGSPRHIEIQVLADQHGNVTYLFERECSVQRRHQKVIEEAPSAILTPEIRKEMGEAAVNVCRACNYVNAGTVEFLMDENLNFYFLEMNTRLQVEHPVTEMITGIDLVREQIRVAEGHPLSFSQEDLTINGHSLEVRVYAEDPTNNFLPDIGKLHVYSRPQGSGVRVDDGFEEGMDIPIYYDPMIAKLIVHAADRPAAIRKMIRAIDEYKIVGIETTLAFCRFVMEHEAFTSGNFDTHFVKKYFTPQVLKKDLTEDEAKIASLIADQLFHAKQGPASKEIHPYKPKSAWRINRG
ncbi:MAG: acetyl-CoA carboxylase biotin carboxylase subunit [Bacteroidia bacterium]|nr:acetyl-CoA carboxylase biotin carboxylase subunit [Bacteroidia bacterium]